MMVQKRIRGGMFHIIYRYGKANNKYMKNYDKNMELSYSKYFDANNLYGWAISQKLAVDGFEWIEKDNLSKFNESFIKNYDEKSDKGYILEADMKYSKNLHMLHSDLPFLPKRMKINEYRKLPCTIEDKKNYVVHITALKQALNHGLILKKIT